jgi:hypothetical protein
MGLPPRSTRTLSPAALWIPAIALLAYGCYYFMTFTLDDPFISFRYAENLARGRGLVFNPGERVEGYSNLTWVLLMSVFAHLGLEPSHTWGMVLVSKLLGAALAFACLPLMLRLSRRFDPDDEPHAWLRGLPALVLGVSMYFAMWAVGGLETSLYTFLLLWCGDLYLRGLAGSRRALFASVGVIGLLGITRPEGFVIAAAFAVHLVFAARGAVVTRQARVAWLGLYAACMLALVLFRVAYYGDWLPNTYYAKADAPRLWTYLRGLYQASEGLLATVGLPLLVLVPLAWSRRLPSPAWSLSLLVCAFGLAFVVRAGGDWMPGYRFVVPILPWLGLLLEASIRALVRRSPVEPGAPPPARSRVVDLGVAALVFAAGFVLVRARIGGTDLGPEFRPLHKGGRLIQTPYLDAAFWVRENLPAQDWIAVGEAGVIPYFAPQRFIDLLALNDPVLARAPSLFDAEYIFARDPEYVLLAGLHQSHERLVCRYPYGDSLLVDPRFSARYSQCRSFGLPPEQFTGAGQNFVLYARRDRSCTPEAAQSGP